MILEGGRGGGPVLKNQFQGCGGGGAVLKNQFEGGGGWGGGSELSDQLLDPDVPTLASQDKLKVSPKGLPFVISHGRVVHLVCPKHTLLGSNRAVQSIKGPLCQLHTS